jgi:predicted phosphodiesterase
VRSDEEKHVAMGWRKTLPASDYEEIDTFTFPAGSNRILILSDIHLPYQDNEALSIAIDYGIKHGANCVFLNGDTIDMYQASRFIKDPRLRSLSGELQMTRDFFETLNEAIPGPIYFKLGNHEERWENYLKVRAPELLGITDFELQHILKFGQYGVQLIKSKQKVMIGKLAVMHGHEFGNSVFSPVNPARGLFMKAKASCIIGHHHQTSEHSEKDMHGNVVTTFSQGCLCGLSPEYLPYNKWNHGFIFVEAEPSGDYKVKNLRIIDGKVR